MATSAKEQIPSLFVGEQSIKTVMAGSKLVYDRPGGYVYINLNTEDDPAKIQNEKE